MKNGIQIRELMTYPLTHNERDMNWIEWLKLIQKAYLVNKLGQDFLKSLD